jgi:hypothetical protein
MSLPTRAAKPQRADPVTRQDVEASEPRQEHGGAGAAEPRIGVDASEQDLCTIDNRIVSCIRLVKIENI